jgi:hypothetical protein
VNCPPRLKLDSTSFFSRFSLVFPSFFLFPSTRIAYRTDDTCGVCRSVTLYV